MKSIAQAVRTSWFSSLVTLVGMVAGFYVSLFSNEIKAALKALVGGSLLWPDAQHLIGAVLATLFFGVVLSASLTVQREDSLKAQEDSLKAQDFAKAQGNALRLKLDDVLSIPPRGFLKSFEQFALDIGMLGFAPSSNADLLDNRVKSILHAIASLAQQYDEASSETDYTACYYLYHPREALEAMSDHVRESLGLRLTLTENNAAGLAGMAGLLELRDGMSVTVRNGKIVEGPGIAPLVLGVAERAFQARRSSDELWPVLPGAPWSVVSGDYFVAPTLQFAYDWLANHADVTHGVRSEFRNYFSTGPGQLVKSFASVPIASPIEDVSESDVSEGGSLPVQSALAPISDKVLGVLTVHSSEQGVLRSLSSRTDVAKVMFLPLLQPFLIALMVETISAKRLSVTPPG